MCCHIQLVAYCLSNLVMAVFAFVAGDMDYSVIAEWGRPMFVELSSQAKS